MIYELLGYRAFAVLPVLLYMIGVDHGFCIEGIFNMRQICMDKTTSRSRTEPLSE